MSSQRIAALNESRSYPVMIRGLIDGKPSEKEYQAKGVTAAYSAHHDWAAILDLGASVDVILSNTGDKGYELDSSDESSLLAHPEALPKSFPAKLLVLLHQRWQRNPDASLSVFPCELISRNGDKLRSILIELAHDWKLPDSFVQWLEMRCIFANSLVDRIVSEPLDPIGAVAEPYALWAIENADGLRLPCEHEDIVVTDDLARYERLKLYLLNLGHTFIAEQWLKGGARRMKSCWKPCRTRQSGVNWKRSGVRKCCRYLLRTALVNKRRLMWILYGNGFSILSSSTALQTLLQPCQKKQRRFAPVIARATELGLNLAQSRLKAAVG
jgi:tagaturonate reductase